MVEDEGTLLYQDEDNGEFVEAPDSSELVDNTTARITLELTAESDLVPEAEVTLKISGEAQEEIDGGTVTIRLPTLAVMSYSGDGAQLYMPTDSMIPAHASWELPSMSAGDTWEQTVTIPAAVAGYYSVAAVADTYGPESDLGSYLFDEVYTQAWLLMPWRNLNLAAERINSHFVYSRDRLNWEIDWKTDKTYYKYRLWWNKVVFGRNAYDDAWTAAHEYTHALHHKSLGHYWKTTNCDPHYINRASSYTCAFKEGLADYGGNVGAPDFPRRNWETFTTSSGLKPKMEGHVAALFHDLIDSENEERDSTTYSSWYVIRVFKSCEVKHRGWRKRNDVGDFVWCLENRVNSTLHRRHFPGTMVPRDARETAWEPSDWNANHIRSTWLLNLTRED